MAANTPRIEGYEIGEEATSARGITCFSARQVSMDREVWIEFLNPEMNTEAAERFVQVMKRVGRLSHQNLAKVIEAGMAEERAYAIFEKPSGITVVEDIDKHGCYDWPEALHAVIELLAAMEALHSLDVASGNISPVTTYISEEGHLTLLFNGIAQEAAGPYSAPERKSAAGQGVDFKTDVYSAGATFLFMLTGRPPATEEEITNPRDSAYIPENAGMLIERMMARDPAERPQASQALEILRKISSGEAVEVPTPKSTRFLPSRKPMPEKKRRSGIPTAAYIAAGVSAVLIVLGIAVFSGIRSARNNASAPPGESTRVITGSTGENASDTPGPAEDAGGAQSATNSGGPSGAASAGDSARDGALPALGSRQTDPLSDSLDEPAKDTGSPQAGPGLDIEPAGASRAATQEDFQQALEYAAANPNDRDGIISRFQSISRRAQSRELAEKCAEQVRLYTEKAREGITVRLVSDITLAKELASQGKMTEAVTILSGYDESILEPREIALLKDTVDEITAPLRERADELEQKIRTALDNADPAAAETALASLASIQLPDIEKRLERSRKLVDELREKLEECRRQKRMQALNTLKNEERLVEDTSRQLTALHDVEKEITTCMKTLKVDNAISALRGNIPSIPKYRDVLNIYLNLLLALDERVDLLINNLLRAGEEKKRLTLHKGGSFTGYVKAVSRKELTLQLLQGHEMRFYLYDLDQDDFFRYAEMDRRMMKDRLDKGAYFFFTGRQEEARRVLENLLTENERALAAEILLQRMAHKQERELQARRLLIKARRAYYEGKPAELRDALGELEDYSDTDAYKAAESD